MSQITQQVIIQNFVAGEDLTSYRYHLVTISGSTARTVVRCSSQGQSAVGVLVNKPGSGEAAAVCMLGITKVMVGGTIYAGDKFTTSVSATAITLASSENNCAGMVLSNVASGALVDAIILPGLFQSGKIG